MSAIKDGGPAFPIPITSSPDGTIYDSLEFSNGKTGGMSLRDYFAAQAIAAVWRDIPDDVSREMALVYLGECCFEMADAMLRAREAS